jgi:hypothetical protein
MGIAQASETRAQKFTPIISDALLPELDAVVEERLWYAATWSGFRAILVFPGGPNQDGAELMSAPQERPVGPAARTTTTNTQHTHV